MKVKLSISKHFLEAFARLGKKEQKKAHNFLKKFQENPASSAINLEKIDSFKDPNLRSARVSDDIRAIIHVPESGNLYHVLWVDHHDEAYRWASNKSFEWNRKTQSFQYFETPETETEPQQEETEPVGNDSVIGQLTDDQITALGIPEVLIPSVRNVRSLDDLQEIEPYLPQQSFEYLFYLLDGLSYEDVLNEIEVGKTAGETEAEQPEASYNYQREFKVIADDKELEDVLSDSFEAWKVFLHPTQRSLAYNDYNGAVKVTGGAGTGKTIAAVHRAKKLSRADNSSISRPVLFTTFTKALAGNLKELLQKAEAQTDHIHLEHIHGFIVQKALELGLLTSTDRIIDFYSQEKKDQLWDEVVEKQLSEYDTAFLKNEYQHIVQYFDIRQEQDYLKVARRGRKERLSRKERKKVWELIEAYRSLKNHYDLQELSDLANSLAQRYQQAEQKPFSYVIADEIQDFTNIELRLIRSMVEEGGNDLFLTGDPFQTIYKKRINFSECGINIRGRRSKRLKINYRTTEEIRRFAVSAVANVEYDNFDGQPEEESGYVSLLNGRLPVYRTFKSRDEELAYILEEINPSLDEYNEEVIPLSSICVACRTRDSLKEIQKYFHSNKIPYVDVSNEIKKGSRQGVSLSTLHNMKGLEFKKVVLADINNQTVPLRPYGFESWTDQEKEEHEKRERALLYVAMTRAISELVITGTGNRTELV